MQHGLIFPSLRFGFGACPAFRLPTASVLVLALLMLMPQPPVGAQTGELDESEFVRGLRERNMQDLLHYHLEENPPEDPLEEQAIRIELYRLDFEDEGLSPRQRSEAVDQVLDAYRALIEAAPQDHPRRPIWRTELAEFILRVALPIRHVNAGEFVEFGLPTRAARAAFDRLALEAYEQMEHAYLEAFRLQGELPRRDDFQSAYVNPGFWGMLNREIIDRRLPYAYGWASYYATLASDPAGSTHEALEQLDRVARGRLGEQAEAELDSLVGRVLVQAGHYGRARERLEGVIEAGGDITGPLLWAELAWVHALKGAERESDAVERVEAILDRFREVGQVAPPLVILVHDAWFRVTDDYDVYEQLFEDPLVAHAEDQVRGFVVARLAADPMTPEELVDEPPLVVLAHADARVEQAVAMLEGEEEGFADEFRVAHQVLTDLIDRDELDESTEAQARFRIGALEHRRRRPADAVEAWAELARLLPEEPEAVNAAVNAFSVAYSLYRDNRDNQRVIELFDDASTTLLEYHGEHRLARQHTYTRAAFLRRQRRYEEAIAAYYDVPNEHPFYADALYEIAVIHHTQWLEAEAEDRATHARRTLEAADAAINAFEAQEPPADRRASVMQKHGDALLLKTEVVLQQLDEADRAEQVLEAFDDRFAGFDDLQRMQQRLRVNIAVSLGRFEEARQRVQAFAEQGAEEGGGLIQRALDSVNRRAEDLREQGDAEEADRLNDLSVELASDLVEWANRQSGYREEPRRRLPLELILARQYRTAGEVEASRELLETLYERRFGENADGEPVTGADQLEVLYELAQTALAQDDHDRARPLVNRILRLHPSQEGRTWWHAWVMSLQMRDAEYDRLVEAGEQEEANELSGDIFRTIERLRRNDEDLGGAEWDRVFERLTLRHRPN